MMDVDNANIDDEIIFISPDDDFLARQWVSESSGRVPQAGETVRFDSSLHDSEFRGRLVVREVWHNICKYNRRIEVYLETPDPES